MSSLAKDGGPSGGTFSFITEGVDKAVVKTKKVIKRKPRSTIGVKSMRVESRFCIGFPLFVALLVAIISAIKISYIAMMQ